MFHHNDQGQTNEKNGITHTMENCSEYSSKIIVKPGDKDRGNFCHAKDGVWYLLALEQ